MLSWVINILSLLEAIATAMLVANCSSLAILLLIGTDSYVRARKVAVAVGFLGDGDLAKQSMWLIVASAAAGGFGAQLFVPLYLISSG